MTKRELEGLQFVARSPFNVRYDPREDAQPVDLGVIGEDSQGVWVRLHPEVILQREAPDVMPVLDKFRCGQTDLTAADWDELSAPQYDAKFILVDCYRRNTARDWGK